MKPAIRVIGIVLGVALLAYFVHFCIVTFDWEALRRFASWRALLAWGVATLLYCSVVPMSALAWQRLLPASRQRSAIELCGILGATQLAKYVPGNVAQFLGRSALSLGKGMPLPDFVASVTVETVLAVLAGVVVGLWGAMAGDGLAVMPEWVRQWLPWMLAGVVSIIIALPALAGLIAAWAQRRPVPSRVAGVVTSLPTPSAQAFALVAYCVNYLLIGVGLLLVARAVDLPYSYAELTAAFTLSWLVGFFSPGMPAGIGAREGAMTLLLGGAAAAIGELAGVVLVMRLATVAGDVVWFALGSWLLSGRWRNA